MISFDIENKELIENDFTHMYEHKVDEFYELILRYNAIDGVPINSKTPIKVTENHSLMLWDNEERTLVDIPITEAAEDPYRYFFVFKGPEKHINDYIETIDNNTGQIGKIELNYLTGLIYSFVFRARAKTPLIISTDVYEFLERHRSTWEHWVELNFEFYKKTFNSSLTKIKVTEIPCDFKNFCNATIITKKNLKTIANELLYSSNEDFLLGFLEGFIISEKTLTHNISEILVKNTVSINVFTNVLNGLFSNFIITKASYYNYPDDYRYMISFSLAPEKIAKLKLAHDKIKEQQWTWKIFPDGKVAIDSWHNVQDPSMASDKLVSQLIELKENNEIKFVRIDEMIIKHTRVDEPVSLYDISMNNAAGTNYMLPLGPMAKNSDGDVLSAKGVLTKEGLQAAKHLLFDNAERNSDPTDPGTMRNWIQKDAILGLYTATKG